MDKKQQNANKWFNKCRYVLRLISVSLLKIILIIRCTKNVSKKLKLVRQYFEYSEMIGPMILYYGYW